MSFSSGFFNGNGGDRVYDAEDFSRYLEGIIANGCFPNDTGFKIMANPEEIGTNAPSVLINAGKVYCDGYWIHNSEPEVYFLGGSQGITPGLKHRIYVCFDKALRTNTVGHVSGTPEVLTPPWPMDDTSKTYIKLAEVYDRLDLQPEETDIIDVRALAGVAAVTVGTSQITDGAVTNDKIAGGITVDKLAGGITGDKIVSLPSSKITGNFAAERISSGILSQDRLAANSILPSKLLLKPAWSRLTSGVNLSVNEEYAGITVTAASLGLARVSMAVACCGNSNVNAAVLLTPGATSFTVKVRNVGTIEVPGPYYINVMAFGE